MIKYSQRINKKILEALCLKSLIKKIHSSYSAIFTLFGALGKQKLGALLLMKNILFEKFINFKSRYHKLH